MRANIVLSLHIIFCAEYKSGEFSWELFLPSRAARVESFLFWFRPTRIQIVSGSFLYFCSMDRLQTLCMYCIALSQNLCLRREPFRVFFALASCLLLLNYTVHNVLGSVCGISCPFCWPVVVLLLLIPFSFEIFQPHRQVIHLVHHLCHQVELLDHRNIHLNPVYLVSIG